MRLCCKSNGKFGTFLSFLCLVIKTSSLEEGSQKCAHVWPLSYNEVCGGPSSSSSSSSILLLLRGQLLFLYYYFSPGLTPLLFSPPPKRHFTFPQKKQFGIFAREGRGTQLFFFLVSIPPFFFLWERKEKLFSLDYYEHPGWKFSALYHQQRKKVFPIFEAVGVLNYITSPSIFKLFLHWHKFTF